MNFRDFRGRSNGFQLETPSQSCRRRVAFYEAFGCQNQGSSPIKKIKSIFGTHQTLRETKTSWSLAGGWSGGESHALSGTTAGGSGHSAGDGHPTMVACLKGAGEGLDDTISSVRRHPLRKHILAAFKLFHWPRYAEDQAETNLKRLVLECLKAFQHVAEFVPPLRQLPLMYPGGPQSESKVQKVALKKIEKSAVYII